jgi:hypothetical protein
MKASAADANLDKIGLHASDTRAIFSTMPSRRRDNLLGAEEGNGFVQLMQQLPQHLSLAVGAVASDGTCGSADGRLHQRAQGVRRIIEFENNSLSGTFAEMQDRGDDRARLRRLVRGAARAGELDARHRFDGEIRCSQSRANPLICSHLRNIRSRGMFVDARIEKI